MRNLKITHNAPGALKPYERNARTHSKKQVRQIAKSIENFGWTNPVLIDGAGQIIAGHGRVEAAKLLGLPEVPTIRLEDLTEAQKRAYILADNKLAQNAGWDSEILAIELQGLIDLDFEVTVTGFETPEIDLILGDQLEEAEAARADVLPEPALDAPPVSRPGDLWRLGRHRLLCGDATRPESFTALMAGQKAQMVFVDPPYNVPIDGHVCGLGKIKHREFAMATGEMTEAQFTSFLREVFQGLAANSADGSIHYVCMDWRHMAEVLAAGRAAYSELKNLCIWNKTNGGMGAFYRSKHELVFVFKQGSAAHINNFDLGQHGRYRTNVWDYAGINSLKTERHEELAMHPTVKPVALVADAIKDCSRRRGIVLDCFAGGGTILIAAEQTGRRAYAMELDPLYVDTAIRRWQLFAGEAARHAETGRTFEALTTERPAPSAQTEQTPDQDALQELEVADG